MKIILSRKGFDSSLGGCASPILEDGTLVSLPIPDDKGPVTYGDVEFPGASTPQLVEDLTKGRITARSHAHLDPDLRRDALPRGPGWRPMFGQIDAAQGHLANQRVGPGDLLLFFGLFRRVECAAGGYRFQRGSRAVHALFGWLTVDQVWPVWKDGFVAPEWAAQHPHITPRRHYGHNTVYVGAGPGDGLGTGVFAKVRDDLVLTAPGQSASVWRLPRWFYPEGRPSALSYHRDARRWHLHGDHVILDSVGRGQEFVLNSDDYPEALSWAAGSLCKGPHSS